MSEQIDGICCEDFWEHIIDCVDGTINDIKEKGKEIVLIGLSWFIGLPCGIAVEILKKITN